MSAGYSPHLERCSRENFLWPLFCECIFPKTEPVNHSIDRLRAFFVVCGRDYFSRLSFLERIASTAAQAGQSQYLAPAALISWAWSAMPLAVSAPK